MTNTSRTENLIVGAGPYGLALAAHLGAAGIDHHILGQPMSFWRSHMPQGMWLRSSWDASHISSPGMKLSLDAFERDRQTTIDRPIPLDRFLEYGGWFQEHAAPEIDTRRSICIRRGEGRFEVAVGSGERIEADRVFLATGLDTFAFTPAPFRNLSPELATHTSNLVDFSVLAGRKVAVIGGGQSALESAALAREANADVHVFVRETHIHWLRRSLSLHQKTGLVRRMLYPPTDVGPPGLNQIVARPHVWRAIPRSLGARIAYRSIRPAGAGWLVPRLEGVPILLQRTVTQAQLEGGVVRLKFSDGSTFDADQLVLGTGFRIDVSRYQFLDEEVKRDLRVNQGYPVLRRGFESSVRGLHFVGASSAPSFGPVMRFVSGTTFTTAEVLKFLMANRAQRVAVSV